MDLELDDVEAGTCDLHEVHSLATEDGDEEMLHMLRLLREAKDINKYVTSGAMHRGRASRGRDSGGTLDRTVVFRAGRFLVAEGRWRDDGVRRQHCGDARRRHGGDQRHRESRA